MVLTVCQSSSRLCVETDCRIGVLVTAASKEAYDMAGGLLRPMGTVVVVGLPKDPSVIAGAPPIMMALRRLNFVGSVVGSLKDVEEALEFTSRDLVHVWICDIICGPMLTLSSQSCRKANSKTSTLLWRRCPKGNYLAVRSYR